MDAVEVNKSEEEPSTSAATADEEMMDTSNEICRICLLDGLSLRALFHNDGQITLSEKIMGITSVKMQEGDGLPSHICCTCSNKLETAYKFKLEVEEADNVLHERLESLRDIKDHLFFGHLTTHKNDIGEMSEDTLLLKDHMDLLNEAKINDENISESQDVQKQENDINVLEEEIENHKEQDEDEASFEDDKQIEISDDQEMSQINNDSQVNIQEGQEIQETHNETHNQSYETHNETHNQSYETQELQEMMLDEIRDQEELQNELIQNQHFAINEHNYVAESHPNNVSHESNVTDNDMSDSYMNNSEDSKNNIEIIEKELNNEETNKCDEPTESSPPESVRRSKRKINQQKTNVNRDCDEENYFENLNLSFRLKQVQSEKSEKVYFMCYLCDKQFLSKEVLKEHMHSHEEVRKTLSFSQKSQEKLPKTPEKTQNITASPSSPKNQNSGKQLNTCPHCGKEYRYIISYNKHLKQHEREKNAIKQEAMPLEVSFQEDDDILDFQNYDDDHVNFDSEEEIREDERETHVNKESKKHPLLKCDVCTEEFDSMDKLKNHKSKHVENVLTEQNLKDNIGQSNTSGSKIEKDNDKTKQENSKKEEFKDLKCPQCPMTYAHKKSLSRHMESHTGTKYTCKVCLQNFTRKDHLRRHSEQHSTKMKGFRCTQCNKTFGNELTLRNHLIATNHKTTVRGQEYDPNKRIKRVAAKAAQKIIDQIKTDLSIDDEEEKKSSRSRDKVKDNLFEVVKVEQNVVIEEKKENTAQVPKKFQRNNNLVCPTCNLKCSSKQILAKHMEQHGKDENIIKQEKEKKEESQENEQVNEFVEDDDNYVGGIDWPIDTHECPTCKKRYSTKKSLLRHQLLHDDPNFECDICNVKFYRKDKLKAHYDKCSEKNPDQVRKCNICGDIFENNEILREHRAKHVTEGILTEEDLREIEPKPENKSEEKQPRKRRTDIVGRECTECNKRYTSRKGLLRHIQQVHEGKKYLCEICPKKFYRREHLKIHVAKHNMIKPYKCPRCSKRFIKEEQLNNHISKHDRPCKKPKESDPSKRFLCEICSKSFTQSTTLIAHLRAHNGIKPYVCEVCSRPFTTNAYLKMHMRTHTQERPYICQYCSRAFARADTLANHLTSHTGEAKYHCKYCPKNFRRLKSLKEHVFIHTGQRPYACPTCDRKFNNNGSRYAHSKRCKQYQLQNRQNQSIPVHSFATIEPELQEQQEEHEPQIQLQEHHEIQNHLQQQRIHQATISPAQIIKSQNIKTITITRQDPSLSQQHVMTTHQEILMPLILPLTVTLADVDEQVILPEGTKIFTT